MKYIFQLGIILFVSFIGEILNAVIPLPIPASIYGLVIMLVLLITKIIKLEQVKETGNFLVAIMPIMFIQPATGLLEIWGDIKDLLVPILFITFVTTIIVMVVTGHVTQYIIRRKERLVEKE